MYSPLILSLSLTRGARPPPSAAEPPGCSSPSLSLLDAMAAALLLLAPGRLRFGTRLDELALLLLLGRLVRGLGA